MCPSPFDHSKTLQDFEDKLSEYTRTAVCGRPFVLVDKLQVWLRSQATPTVTNIERQVYAAYRDRSHPLPFRFNIFNAGQDCYLLIFSILHTFGRGDLIDCFSEKGKTDWKLPLSASDVEGIFRAAKASNLAAVFLETQHRFCPARFIFQKNAIWNKDVVIPICSKEPFNEGVTARLWLVDVPEEFIEESLRRESVRSRFNAGSDADPDWRYEFALKTFNPKDPKAFENERKASIYLKDHEGMVRYLASFKKAELSNASDGTNSATTTRIEPYSSCNILLEFADMDLSVYFQNRLPPALAKENEKFWKALFAIATAVKDIHNFKEDRGEEIREYHGWHTDIKPDKILIFDDTGAGVYKFKLACSRFAQFGAKNPKLADVPKRELWGGTKTYELMIENTGPPEYPGKSEHPVSQAIDIWSLGCVFSVAATWAILGFVGVLQFDEIRKRTIEEIDRRRQTQHPNAAPADEQLETDQFHDGYELLDIVTLWHKYLRGRLRKCDTVSAQVLDLVDEKMLITNPVERIKADDLCKQLEKILADSVEEARDNIPTKIQKYLKDMDEVVTTRLESMRH